MAIEEHRAFQLRAYVLIDRMQPQFAAYMGTVVQGDIPVAGMAELYVEVAPGNEIFRVADVALKATNVKPASQVIEREFGLLEVHSFEQEAVREAGRRVLQYLGLEENQRVKPRVVSVQLITGVDPYQAQLINKFRKGTLLVPGETLYVLEVAPAAYIGYAANEAEKAANIKVVEVRGVGRYGRLFLSGTEAEVVHAKDVSLEAIASIEGVEL